MPEDAYDRLTLYAATSSTDSTLKARSVAAGEEGTWTETGLDYVDVTSHAYFVKGTHGADPEGIWTNDGKKYHVVWLTLTPKAAGEITLAVRGNEFKHGLLATPYYYFKVKVVDGQEPAEQENKAVDKPTAKAGLTYNGYAQVGVPSGEGYDITGNSETDAGDYEAVAKLQEGYTWSDGSTEELKVEWSIAKAKLHADYVSESVRPDAVPAYQVRVTLWKGSDTAENAAGYKAPTVDGPETLEPNKQYTDLKPSGGEAKNYYFEYYGGTLTVLGYKTEFTPGDDIGTLANLKAGEGTTSVGLAYSGRSNVPADDVKVLGFRMQGNNQVSYDYSGILEASYDPASGKLSVTPLAEGSCLLIVTVSGDDSYDDARSDKVTVTIAAADKQAASLEPESGYQDKLGALEAGGEPVEVSLAYTGNPSAQQADVSVSPGQSDVAEVSYDVAAGKLAVTPKAEGSATFTVTVAGGDGYEDATFEATVTVGAAQPDPIQADAEYELVVGGDAKDISYSGELGYEVDKDGIVQVTKSEDGTTLTVAPVSAGTAVVTVTAVGTDLDPVAVKFTVKAAQDPEGGGEQPAAKGTVALDPITVAAGASKEGNIAIKDADGNTVASGIAATSSDPSVATASYADGKLTVKGVSAGTATVTLSSEALDDDYTIAVTVTAAADDGEAGDGSTDGATGGNTSTGTSATGQTVTFTDASGDGVKAQLGEISLDGAGDGATVTLVANGLAADSDSFATLKSKVEGTLLSAYSVTLKVDGQEVHDGFGKVTLSFPAGEAYEGKEVVVWHLHHDGTATSESATVKDGLATVTVTDLSDFAVETGKDSSSTATSSSAGSGTSATSASGTASSTPGSNLSKTGDGAMAAAWAALVVAAVACAGGVALSRRRSAAAPEEDSAEEAA